MIPKYIRIADDLRQAILNGDHAPGSTLPSETDLLTRYQVSRGTVRQAVALLTAEGLVTPIAGTGTIVRERSPVSMTYTPDAPNPTWEQSNADDDAAVDTLVSTTWELADSEIADRLAIKTGHRVLHRVRHQSRGAGVAQIHEQWIPKPIAATILAQTGLDLANRDNVPGRDLFKLLGDAGHPPATTTETIGARMPDPTERDVMALPPGVPVLTILRITRADNGTPLETSDLVNASDRCTHTYTVSLTDR
jgi:GntR family transcriptional regulator